MSNLKNNGKYSTLKVDYAIELPKLFLEIEAEP